MLSRIHSLQILFIFPILKRTYAFTTIANIRKVSTFKVLGIETSCDDTAAAVVDSDSNILGEAHNSQQEIHAEFGGIIPNVAKNLHKQHIKLVVDEALSNANCTVNDIDAIAVTLKPGLAFSLYVGMEYAKNLSRTFNKPFIPIHHMEAHALTPRLLYKDLQFPFMVLLVSGGHCLLSLAKSPTEFYTLGRSLDDAPGEAFDKIARYLKLRNKEEFRNKSGGYAIEVAAEEGDPFLYELKGPVLAKFRSCDFSFSGLKNEAQKRINESESYYKVKGGRLIPDYADHCATFQYLVTKHICERVQRSLLFVELENLIPQDENFLKRFVISGGVACNKFLVKSVQKVCKEHNFEVITPEPKLCQDNGVMIAWNGVELYRINSNRVIHDLEELDNVDLEAKCDFGEDWSHRVKERNIKISHSAIIER